MDGFRFIHTADLHLDSPFKGLTHIPNHHYKQMRNSTFFAFQQIIQYCLDYQVDFLLISGDVYDLQDHSLKAQVYFLNGLEKLNENGIQVYVVHGNHDAVDQLKSWLNWPENVHFFSSDHVEVKSYRKQNKEVARIFGRSYPTRAFKENIVDQYKADKTADVFQIGLLHTNVDGNSEHDVYAPSSLKELLDSAMDYWALGHIHKKQLLSKRYPTVVYPGNPQGRHMKETGIKSCVLVEVENKEVSNITWLPTSQIVWEKVAVNLEKAENLHEVLHLIQSELDQLRANIKVPSIVRVFLTGNTKLHHELSQGESLENIQMIVNDVYSKEDVWTWIESVVLATRSYAGIEEILQRDDFLAEFYRQLHRFKDQLDEDDWMKEMPLEIAHHRGVRKFFSSFSEEQWEEIFQQAANIAIDFLTEEGV